MGLADTISNIVGGSKPTGSGSSTYQKLGYEGGQRDGNGRRNADVCMVFRYKTSKTVRFEEGQEDMMAGARQLAEPTEAALSTMHMWKQRRESILKSLQNCGLHCFCFYSRDRDEIICKIGADVKKLQDTAARMKYKLQLKPEYESAFAEYRHDFPGRPELNFTDRRVVSHIYKTHTQDDFPSDDAIFTTLDKILIIHHIITSNDKECAGINIGQLLHQEELKAYFPLHEPAKLDEFKVNRIWDLGQWILMLPEHTMKVRNYFGDKIAFYFLWLSFYWKWLVLISIMGLGKQFIDMICGTPDNWSSLPFCVLLAIWCTFLPHFWRRQEAKVALSWGSFDFVDKFEPCRPEHWGEPRINPVTAQVESYYPFEKRLLKYAMSAAVVLFAGVVLVLVIFLLLIARHERALGFGIIFYQFLMAAAVEFMNFVLSRIARFLTYQENHRTRSEHEWHQLAKVMSFKFINSYFVLYYVAYFKHNSLDWFGLELNCLHDDCFVDIKSQLAIFVLFRLVVQNGMELFMPRIRMIYRSWFVEGKNVVSYLQGHNRLELADMSNAEQESKKNPYNSFSEFDEALISHGYATLFAVACPWVCFLTLLGTLFEIYVDLKGLTEQKQRTMPVKCRSNEPWSTAFTIYGALAAFTNIFFLICAAENQAFAQMKFTEKLAAFLFVEHLIILANLLLRMLFPEVPRGVELLQLKQANVVHRCLENIKVSPTQDYTMFREHEKNEYEVFEHDYMEEDGDAEPQLSLGESARTMYNGIGPGLLDVIPSRQR
mmetsp:Transcript_31868/g.88084  ORF Transcript_31868/g.88084 Transcript_31868/m.88084 type:complete len:772 (-) Transcript_31868:217-2532(-)